MASKPCPCGGTGNRPVYGNHPWIVDAVYPCPCTQQKKEAMTGWNAELIIDRFAWKEGGKWVHTFLSNFFESPFWDAGLEWPTLEHAYQAAKTTDPDERRSIQQARTAGEAKDLGRKATLRDDWDQIKDNVMLRLLRIKFGDDALRRLLVQTGDADLIEGNTWHDQYWGDCTCGRKACQDTGKNMLGILLMKVRDEINGKAVAGLTQTWNGEGSHTIAYTVHVTSYGHKDKVMQDVTNTLERVLSTAFDDRAAVVDTKWIGAAVL